MQKSHRTPILSWGVVTVSVALFSVTSAFFGWDITDEGYHLTAQSQLISEGYHSGTPPLTLLSNYAGGLWLKLFGVPTVWGARLGGSLIFILTALVSFAVLKRFFNPQRTAVVVSATSLLLVSWMPLSIIDYFTFPALVLSVWLYCLTRVAEFPPGGAPRWAILAGLTGGLLLYARFNTLLLILAPVGLFLLHRVLAVDKKTLRRLVGWYSMSAILGVLAILLVLIAAGNASVYGEGVRDAVIGGFFQNNANKFNAVHTADYLLPHLFRSLLAVTLTTLALLLFRRGLRSVQEALGSGGTALVVLLISISFLSLPLMLSAIGLGSIAIQWIITPVVCLGLIRGFSALYHAVKKRRALAPWHILLLLSLLSLFLFPLGSRDYLFKMIYAAWILLPLLTLYALRLMRKQIQKPIPYSKIQIGIISALVAAASFFTVTWVYRDAPLYKLTSRMDAPGLALIQTTPARAQAITETLDVIHAYTQPGDPALMLNSIPHLYYLTQTRPWLETPWPSLGTLESIQRRYSSADFTNRPHVVVLSKKNTRQNAWPDTESIANPEDLRKIEFYRTVILDDLGYLKIHENTAFEVYLPPR